MGKEWKAQTKKDGQEIKEKIGEDATVSIFDEFDKNCTATDQWGRGGEVLYQAFDLKMPDKLNDLVKKKVGQVKQEKIADYAGDYIVSTSEGKSNQLMKNRFMAKYTSCSKIK